VLPSAGAAGAALEKRFLRAGRAYARLGTAAMDGSAARFDAARDEVSASERNVAGALARLRAETSP
jgi:hypothetical protein